MTTKSQREPVVTHTDGPLLRLPDAGTLQQVFHLKYGPEAQLGWGPRLRRDHGYSTPDDV